MRNAPTYWIVDCQHSEHPPAVTTSEREAVADCVSRSEQEPPVGTRACELLVVRVRNEFAEQHRYVPASLQPVTAAGEAP